MRSALFFVLFCLIGKFDSLSQSFGSHSIALTPTAFPKSDFDKEAYRKRLHEKLAAERNTEMAENYINDQVIGMDYFFSSNLIYTNWPQASDYVKSVFAAAIPAPFNVGQIKIYVMRDSDPNAFCMEDGNIAVTVGFLSFMKNEAELASVLCHEFGHYYSSHNYSNYQKSNKNKMLKELFVTQSVIASLAMMKNVTNFMKDQERDADTFAYNFFAKNGYSPESIAETFVSYQKITDKYKKLRGYRRPLIYFSTHPSNKERVDNARAAFKERPVSGKAFQADPFDFIAIKERATDETIYLLFEQLQYDECLEMAYLQYLYHPEDEFYLFFITECLRRKITLYSDCASDYFITGNYKDLSNPAEVQDPVFLKGAEKRISPKSYAKSVFANLQNEIYSLSEEDLKKIKAPGVVKPDTLEYLSNGEALAYFLSKTQTRSCIFNLQKWFTDRLQQEDCSHSKESSELEADYTQIVSNYKKFELTGNTYRKAPVILFNIRITQKSGNTSRETYDPQLFNEIHTRYKEQARLYADTMIDVVNKFNFRELQKIQNTTLFIESLGLKNYFGGKETESDFLAIFPELTSEINKFNYRKLLFLEITTINAPSPNSMGANSLFSGMAGMEGWTGTIYTVDLVNKKISKTVKNLHVFNSAGTRQDKINKILDACLQEALK
jgi:hypothetical protein